MPATPAYSPDGIAEAMPGHDGLSGGEAGDDVGVPACGYRLKSSPNTGSYCAARMPGVGDTAGRESSTDELLAAAIPGVGFDSVSESRMDVLPLADGAGNIPC